MDIAKKSIGIQMAIVAHCEVLYDGGNIGLVYLIIVEEGFYFAGQ